MNRVTEEEWDQNGPFVETYANVIYTKEELEDHVFRMFEKVDQKHLQMMTGLATIAARQEEINKNHIHMISMFRALRQRSNLMLVLLIVLIVSNIIVSLTEPILHLWF